jgi:hypothetical protein
MANISMAMHARLRLALLVDDQDLVDEVLMAVNAGVLSDEAVARLDCDRVVKVSESERH